MLNSVIYIGAEFAIVAVLLLLIKSLRYAQNNADSRLAKELFIHNRAVLRKNSGVSEDESYQGSDFLKMHNTGYIPDKIVDIPFKSFSPEV